MRKDVIILRGAEADKVAEGIAPTGRIVVRASQHYATMFRHVQRPAHVSRSAQNHRQP